MVEQFEPQAYRVATFCTAFAIGRSAVYEEIAKGRLKIFKVGRGTFISRESAQAWLRLCQQDSPQKPKTEARLPKGCDADAVNSGAME